ncbi:MAG: hypothetical protein ACI4HI_07725 [Lachnospiraceae bacterium]
MNEGLFRKKSIEKISSPEQLNEYIRVSNPSVWMILSCIIILLIGMCVWGIFGRFETTLEVSAISKDGETVCYVKEENVSDITEGMNVQIEGTEYPVKGINTSPVQITEDFESYALHIGDLQTGEWVYEVTIDAGLGDGVYEAEIITESIAPMSFLLN